jgi:large subunit ribosomal protein L29
MKPAEIRDMSTEQIRQRLEQAREEHFKLRFQFATGQLPNHTRLRLVRRDIARLATVLRERELGAGEEAEGS